MEYAIIETGGKQYKAAIGTILDVEKLTCKAGESFVFDRVLLYAADGVCKVGQPQVNGVTVTAKILGQFKADKIRVAKYKAKARYRKVNGHRQQLTRIQITEISTKAKISKTEDTEKPEIKAQKSKIKTTEEEK